MLRTRKRKDDYENTVFYFILMQPKIFTTVIMTTPIKTILNTVLSQHNNWQLQLLDNWPSIVGHIKTKVQLLKMYEDTLVIGVQDSCWLQELYLLTPLLLQTINQKLDRPRIKKLRFKAVGVTDTKIKKKTPITRASVAPVQLSVQEQQMLASIKDGQLRAVLKDYLVRCYREREHEA